LTSKRKGFAAGLAGWVFGLASTVLLVGVWGRAVVTDTDELANSLSPMATSQLVADRFAGWLETELVESGVDDSTAGDTTDRVMASPELSPILGDLVGQAVLAAASSDPSGAVVDVATVLSPAIPQITVTLNEAGVPATETDVARAVEELDPIVIRDPLQSAFVGPESPLAARLGTAVMLAIVALIGAGLVYVRAASDRMSGLRSLLTRFALGALSFAVLLRVGSWITDPRGGRAPVGETISLLAQSKWMIPLLMGSAAAGAALVFWVFRRRVRPGAKSPIPSDRTTPLPAGQQPK
jgi:hypothetical protein